MIKIYFIKQKEKKMVFKIKHKINFILSVIIFLSIVFLFLDIFFKKNIINATEEYDQTISSVRQIMTADMIHDNIKGTAYHILYRMAQKTPVNTEQEKKYLDENCEKFLKNFRQSYASTTNSYLLTHSKDIEDLFKIYISIGKDMVEDSKNNDGVVSKDKIQRFSEVFESLAEKIEKFSDAIESRKISANNHLNQSIEYMHDIFLFASIILTILSLTMLLIINKKLISPIDIIRDVMNSVSSGDLKTSIPYQDQTDEIGEMARSIQVFRKTSSDIQLMNFKAKEDAEKNEEHLKRELSKLSSSLEKEMQVIVDAIHEKSKKMEDVTEKMLENISTINKESKNLSNTSDQSSSDMSDIHHEIEKLLDVVQLISYQMSDAKNVSQSAVGKSQDAGSIVQNLHHAARRINDVISLIAEVAEQTSLLAINATIEAARAGEAGKGFSVVAAEVQNLANKTTQSADEISSQIIAVQDATQNAVQAIQEITDAIQKVDEISHTVSSGVETHRTATDHISKNIFKVTGNSKVLVQSSKNVSQYSENIAMMFQESLRDIQDLKTQANQLQIRLKTISKQFL
jgi:methyl-accepting chemotaxis protein